MRYAVSKYSLYSRETAYRIYVTDTLRIITENTAKASRGTYLQKRYADIIAPRTVSTKTGEQIAMEVIKKAGLEVLYNEPI